MTYLYVGVVFRILQLAICMLQRGLCIHLLHQSKPWRTPYAVARVGLPAVNKAARSVPYLGVTVSVKIHSLSFAYRRCVFLACSRMYSCAVFTACTN